jgi:hypothetical protein
MARSREAPSCRALAVGIHRRCACRRQPRMRGRESAAGSSLAKCRHAHSQSRMVTCSCTPFGRDQSCQCLFTRLPHQACSDGRTAIAANAKLLSPSTCERSRMSKPSPSTSPSPSPRMRMMSLPEPVAMSAPPTNATVALRAAGLNPALAGQRWTSPHRASSAASVHAIKSSSPRCPLPPINPRA